MNTRREILTDVLAHTDGIAPSAHSPLHKHVKMSENPFRFMRGSAPLFYQDLAAAASPALPQCLFRDIPLCIVQGDCHIANFGFITEEGSHGDHVIFALNDFDDACVGHALWDILRYATSVHLACDYLRGLVDGTYASPAPLVGNAPSADTPSAAVRAFLQAYVDVCQTSVSGTKIFQQVINGFDKKHFLHKLWKKAKKRANGGRHFHRKSALAKATVWQDTSIAFDRDSERFAVPDDAETEALTAHFAPFMDDAVLDVVERLGAGTGSVNMTRYYFLVGPERATYPEQLPLCHIVEVKQQRCAAPLKYFTHLSPMNRLSPAHLTVACQRRIQRQPDLILDATHWRGAHWLLRSRHHAKVGIDPENMLQNNASTHAYITDYAHSCGRALALAHCRSDRRSTHFEAAVCRHLPQNFTAILDASYHLADTMRSDWALLTRMLT